ncbi:unnamed protein product, partial [Symbiodinium pilosum]
DLARFTSEGSAAICALDEDLKKFLQEQEATAARAKDLQQLLARQRPPRHA